ncbi:short-chain dehydrogenase/reductase [Vairimorpha necatrix]|uniref:Short-chain dehydrogenase/reductase n=1 Tax=Vairimorpha necatrix TaxID=6039 RepID=A0AAX4JDW5_9MICR
MNLQGRIVGISGGNSGLGLAIVELLVNVCYKVIVIDKSDICERLRDIPNVEYIQCDLSNPDFAPFRVDVFIHNVGMSIGPKLVRDTSYLEMKKMIEVNILSHLYCVKNIKCRKHVFIASVLSYVGIELYSCYSSSKAFMRSFVESLQREGYDTMIVFPYKMNTPMFKEIKDLNTLDVDYVAKEVIVGIEKNKREMVVPRYYVLIDMFKGFVPNFIKNFALDMVAEYFVEKKAIEELKSLRTKYDIIEVQVTTNN